MKNRFISSLAMTAVLLSSFVLPGWAEQQKKKVEESGDIIKLDTTLVTVPVIVSDRNDVYIPGILREEFSLFEDGVRQEIVFFAATEEPFNVVLMLDTSGSTREKIGSMQRAASAFVAQLKPADRIKLISFDDAVRELSPFTNDRAELNRAIRETQPGQGTKLYDAMRLALNNLVQIKGRKAIVIFTDGVDWRSDQTTYDDNLKAIEESGVIVYPIRYETRAETEALVREQSDRYGSASDVGLILGGPPIGTTPPTTPGGGPSQVPQRRSGNGDDPWKLPGPDPTVILRDPRVSRYPGQTPGGRLPDDRFPDNRNPDNRFPDNRFPDNRSRFPDDRTGRAEDRFPDSSGPDTRRRSTDSISVLLDNLYYTGDRYLLDIARISGGKHHRADSLRDLPAAFEQIAEELRQQYALGYYSSNASNDGKYRKIQVRVNRKDSVVRARPGYRTPKP